MSPAVMFAATEKLAAVGCRSTGLIPRAERGLDVDHYAGRLQRIARRGRKVETQALHRSRRAVPPRSGTTMVLPLRDETCAPRSTGAPAGMTIVVAGAGVGVMSTAATLKAASRVIVPPTLPVWNRAALAPSVKIASRLLAGMRKLMVRPPEANWMAGSSAKEAELKLRARVPLRSSG